MLKEKIQEDLVGSQKEKEELKVSTLRLLIAAIKNFEIAKQGTSYQASDEEILGVIQKEIKQRKESIEQFKVGGRQDLADKETKEMEILQQYLPEQIGDQEIEKIVVETIQKVGATAAADIGKVMGALSQELKGKADLSMVSQIVREKLSS
ncbi:MAG: hypothetical protein A2126_00120 [Candidatus Woykebacteria bacterium GWB1_45_5]|uniref:Glutamyl-tRNA amidotransferase n=2 Tax=Candidatus Woykeibacteriota TaxID=1817899 RepID=A0A1G1W356_9BACT|nr:MAG: hypothetical protein A2113_02715 [Candidatus Woykebacteria bacterium GWA1_44_8]OGY23277.1 MAG: hypothetical protein A2126_00120 [Candidatus Woykebacteria bacterium GWB1_45_5]